MLTNSSETNSLRQHQLYSQIIGSSLEMNGVQQITLTTNNSLFIRIPYSAPRISMIYIKLHQIDTVKSREAILWYRITKWNLSKNEVLVCRSLSVEAMIKFLYNHHQSF